MQQLLIHRALTITRDDNEITLSQPINDPDDPDASVSITISVSQALDIASLLTKVAGKAAKKAPPAGAQHFDEFWIAYPAARRFNHAGMLRKWVELKLDAQWEQISGYLNTMLTSNDWTKEGGKYVPQITTFINQRRWEAAVGTNGSPRVDL